jgi:hypothetical protein
MLALFLALASIAASPPPLLQAWSDKGLIAADDDWSRVPALVGYRGDGLAVEPGIDPRSVTADGSSTPVDVTANRGDPRAVGLAAGVAEFELADPVVAIQGSATASAPHLVLSLDTRGRSGVSVRLVLRDIDASGADAVEPVAIQYRVGAAGAYTAAPGGYVADTTTGPNAATLVTPVRTTLPSPANNQPLVQVRMITTNAVGQDEWVGIDDIEVTADATGAGPGACPPAPGPPAPGPPAPAPPAPAPPAPGPPAPAPSPSPEPVALELTQLALLPDSFTPARKGPAIGRRGGVRLRFRLSRAALVRFDATPVRAPDDLARTRQPRPITGGRFSVRAKRGLNRLRFSGRIHGRPLAPGRYFLTAVATDRAKKVASEPRSVPFSITEKTD